MGCINQHYTESVPIRQLQRWVSRKAVAEGWAAESRPAPVSSGKSVAVLGAGPAGVSAAITLAGLGHKVTLFDRSSAAGGTARETIPGERLPDAVVRDEIRDVLMSSGNIARAQAHFDVHFTLDHVLAEGFDAALIAFGLSRSVELASAARPHSGVMGALEFLKSVKGRASVSGTVLVIGGGNTAIDAALSAQRAGASDVSIVYRRSFAEMPASPEERDLAIRSGVHLLILTAPLGYATDSEGALIGLKVARTRLGQPGPDGRRKPEMIQGSEHVLPADLIVEAIGQQLASELESALRGVRLTPDGLVWTRDQSLETSRSGVFAAGDIVNGGTTVVQAVAEGARAAREIDEYFGNLRGL
jgi:NADPH-dependent glutamate synthase beta subunit-like oxidoreductase